jgi:hypothetical protein
MGPSDHTSGRRPHLLVKYAIIAPGEESLLNLLMRLRERGDDSSFELTLRETDGRRKDRAEFKLILTGISHVEHDAQAPKYVHFDGVSENGQSVSGHIDPSVVKQGKTAGMITVGL